MLRQEEWQLKLFPASEQYKPSQVFKWHNMITESAESRELERYTAKLHGARSIGIRRGFLSGFGIGLTLFIMFGSYALALWYGSQQVIDGVKL